ncbi:MAG: MetQ/NlpA family ABC transporter substrate-binding protein [Limnobacter sp.]|nr:MetQ/NlpA family ABC transporter substrate-binding protein [Limnobacter sp.]
MTAESPNRRSLLSLAAAATVLAVLPLSAPVLAQDKPLRVGVTAGPHAEIMEVVKKVAADRGLPIQVVEFTDYVIPNQALADGDIEANSFQHEPYLLNQMSKTNWKLTKVAYTIASPMGFYSNRYESFDALPSGARVAIQNDPTNGARSLQLLHNEGILKLRDPKSPVASVADIVENPKKLKFVELDAAQLARSIPDVDAAAVNNNYAVQAGLDPATDAILSEPADNPWVNIIAVREADKDQPWVAKLVDAYRSEPVREFVETRFKGTYIATW